MSIRELRSDWAVAASRSGGVLKIEEAGSLWPARAYLQRPAGRTPIGLYSRRVGSAGKSRPVTERRFQNPAGAEQGAIDPPEGVTPCLWGLWTEQGTEQMVIVAMDADIRRGKAEKRNSYFIPLERLVEAANRGLAMHRSKSEEQIVAFVPESLELYLSWLERDEASTWTDAENRDLLTDEEELESEEQGRLEGGASRRYSTRYERSAYNRDRAIELHGLACQVCGFDFESVYGELGKGFIHVHHNQPISEAGEKIIDPRTDLNVLCPNCHCMIHRHERETLSVEELRAIYRLSD